MIYYHTHTFFSNIATSDSTTSPEEYIKRNIELGNTTVVMCEHGTTLSYFDYLDSAKKIEKQTGKKIKLIYAVEAYMVLDNLEKDNTNSHIILIAKNEYGRKEINSLISDAHVNGFYYKPRIDFGKLLTVNPDNIIVTTACCASYISKYPQLIDKMTKDLHNHFKENFYLEVQYHNTEIQIEYNKIILRLHNKYNIPLIAGTDSHYIYPDDSVWRDLYIKSKGINYEFEEGWYLDMPSESESIKRFKQQGVLSDELILSAVNNTNKIEICNHCTHSDDIKMPTIYPTLTMEEKNNKLSKIIYDEFKKYSSTYLFKTTLLNFNSLDEKIDEYIKEIEKEINIIKKTNTVDYFLLNYKIVKLAIHKYGGILTQTGRGSATSFLINMFLGFTTIDRMLYGLPLYSERFMSIERILETRSLPDIDINVADYRPFAQAQEELLGSDHSNFMVAFTKLKAKSAWKIYAKAVNIQFITANLISGYIEEYEKAIKYADEDDRDTILIEDFIPENYIALFNESKHLQKIVDSISPSPCSFLLYDKGDISSDIGLIKIKDNICCCIDGKTADNYKYLKNDLLTVSTVNITKKAFDNIGIPIPTSSELLALIDDKTWDVYHKGNTVEINQVAKSNTKNKVMTYKPTTIEELSMFVAAKQQYII